LGVRSGGGFKGAALNYLLDCCFLSFGEVLALYRRDPCVRSAADMLIGCIWSRFVALGLRLGLITTDRSTKVGGVWVFVLVEDSRARR